MSPASERQRTRTSSDSMRLLGRFWAILSLAPIRCSVHWPDVRSRWELLLFKLQYQRRATIRRRNRRISRQLRIWRRARRAHLCSVHPCPRAELVHVVPDGQCMPDLHRPAMAYKCETEVSCTGLLLGKRPNEHQREWPDLRELERRGASPRTAARSPHK
jgi:hypothetical protein